MTLERSALGWDFLARPMRRPFFVTLFAAAMLTLAASAIAQPSDLDRATARRLGDEALDAYDRGELDTARDKFDQAYKLFPTPSLALWSGRMLEESGRAAEAAERYLLAQPIQPMPDWNSEREEQARRDAGAAYRRLAARLAILTVEFSGAPPAEVKLSVNGRPLSGDAEGATFFVDPGECRVVGTWRDQVVEQTLQMAEAKKQTLTLTFTPGAPEADVVPVPQQGPMPVPGEPSGSPAPQPSTYRTAGFVSIGVGAVGLATWAITGAMATSAHDDLMEDCPSGDCFEPQHDEFDAFRRTRTISTVAFVVGVVGATAGVTLLALHPKRQHTQVSVHVSPAGFGLRRTF
jgi:hypothetical protein